MVYPIHVREKLGEEPTWPIQAREMDYPSVYVMQKRGRRRYDGRV